MDSGWRISFFTVWVGQAFSLAGSALVQFALIWWLTEATGSATTLAVATIAGRIPPILLGPIIGPLIDRWSRRSVMAFADGLIALFTAVLAYLFWLEAVETWHVYAVLFVRSLGDIFQGPAMQASTPLMVPGDQLTRVAGMNSALQGAVRFVLPPMGALLLVALDIQGILAIDILTAVPAIGSLLFVRIPRPGKGAAPDGKLSLVGEMGEGFRFLWRAKGLLLLFVTAMAAMLFLAPPLSFVPLLVTEHFGGGALELGWLQSAYGLGYVIGGGLLGAWGGFRRRIATSLVGTVGISLSLVVLGLAPAHAFWLGLVAWFFFGLMLPVGTGPLRAIYQSAVPAGMQGRFFALNRCALSLATPLGLAVGGPLADVIGIRMLFLTGGVTTLAITLVRAFTPAIRALDDASGMGETI